MSAVDKLLEQWASECRSTLDHILTPQHALNSVDGSNDMELWLQALLDHHRQLVIAASADRETAHRLTLSASLRARLWERDSGICGICGQATDPADFHIDHIKPVAEGGVTTEENLQVAHPACNIAKRANWTAADQEGWDSSPISLDD